MKKTTFFFIFLCIFGCEINKQTNKKLDKNAILYLKQYKNKTFYHDFDVFKFEGKEKVTFENASFPFLEVLRSKDSIILVKHDKNKKFFFPFDTIKWIKLKNDCYIRTKNFVKEHNKIQIENETEIYCHTESSIKKQTIQKMHGKYRVASTQYFFPSKIYSVSQKQMLIKNISDFSLFCDNFLTEQQIEKKSKELISEEMDILINDTTFLINKKYPNQTTKNLQFSTYKNSFSYFWDILIFKRY